MIKLHGAIVGACLALPAAMVMPQSALALPPLTVPINSCAAGAATVTGFVGPYPRGTTGVSAPGTMRQFLGIRYAQPPIGPLRWQPPEPACWAGNRPATEPGDICLQNAAGGSENCLFVNVHAPSVGDYSNLPVMVYIHHGSFISGWGNYWGQNPVELVKKGVIVVTFNYRLGALGFLSHPSLDNAAKGNSGNYFLQDQILALKWVKSNIAAFGGDPNNVTLFGHSGAALSILFHLVSPASDGLFHKAILESGGAYHVPFTLPEAQRWGVQFANSAGCKSATCLRALSIEDIRKNQFVLFRGDTESMRVDGVLLTDTFKNLLIAGNFKKVPILTGSNRDEQQHIVENQFVGSGDRCHYVSNLVPNGQDNFPGAVTYTEALVKFYGSRPGLPATVQRLYPSGLTPMSTHLAFQRGQSDFMRACRSLRMHEWMSQAGADIWAYEFNDLKAPLFQTAPVHHHNGQILPFNAYHGAQLQYFFPMPSIVACNRRYPGLSTAQQTLADTMIDYWTTFAKTGDPNPTTGTPRPNWPRFTAPNAQILSLVSPAPKLMAATTFDKAHKCAFWDTNQQ